MRQSACSSVIGFARQLPSRSADRIEYVGDAKLVTRIRESNEFTAKLIFSKAPVRLGRALVGLVKLDDYLRFLRKDGSTVMRDELFAVNVRDYAGAGISVNNAIAETLAADTQSEFWWLNNHVEADEARDPIELSGLSLIALIVRLQTSTYSSSGRRDKSPRSAGQTVRLIRVDPSVREAIIAGTNNQTAIASIQLHANEEKQLRLEEYLRTANWYYERRRYQYRGTATPASRICTVTDVAQAVIAFRLLNRTRPEHDQARC